MINCPHWTKDGRGGMCSGKYPGKRVSLGTCKACPLVRSIDPRPVYPIPDGTTPEIERQRARRGGCCGAPKD